MGDFVGRGSSAQRGFLPPPSLCNQLLLAFSSKILQMFMTGSYLMTLLGMEAIKSILAQQTFGQFQIQSLSGDSLGYLQAQPHPYEGREIVLSF
jgi:hypothetical protein